MSNTNMKGRMSFEATDYESVVFLDNADVISFGSKDADGDISIICIVENKEAVIHINSKDQLLLMKHLHKQLIK